MRRNARIEVSGAPQGIAKIEKYARHNKVFVLMGQERGSRGGIAKKLKKNGKVG